MKTLILLLLPFCTVITVAGADGCATGRWDSVSGKCVPATPIGEILDLMVRPAPSSVSEAKARLELLKAAEKGLEQYPGQKTFVREQIRELEIQAGEVVKIRGKNGVYDAKEKNGQLIWAPYGIELTSQKKSVTDWAKPCTPDKKICAGEWVLNKAGRPHRVSGVFKNELLLEFDDTMPIADVAETAQKDCSRAQSWVHPEKFTFTEKQMRHYQDKANGFYSEGGYTQVSRVSRVEACFSNGRYAVTGPAKSPLGRIYLTTFLSDLDGMVAFHETAYACANDQCSANGRKEDHGPKEFEIQSAQVPARSGQ